MSFLMKRSMRWQGVKGICLAGVVSLVFVIPARGGDPPMSKNEPEFGKIIAKAWRDHAV
jgi:hypothetical protein